MDRKLRFSLFCCIASVAILLAPMLGCEDLHPDGATFDAERQPAYASSSRIWDHTDLTVCFTFDGYDGPKQWVRETITANYEHVSGLTFSGWDRCSPENWTAADITIGNNTEGIWSRIGTDSIHSYPSMELHFDKTNWPGVVNSALHEFAHALGLYHEFDRPDQPGDPSDGHADGRIFGDYDRYSVSVISYNGLAGFMLSPTDIEFLHYYYGTNPEFTGVNDIWETFYYAGEHTNSAQRFTEFEEITLGRGDRLRAGTCGQAFGLFYGDTYLRLFEDGVEVAHNDDACGSYGSSLEYRATEPVTLELHAGCYDNLHCEGVVSYTIDECTPLCGPGRCGSDGCLGSCPSCPSGQRCSGGMCVPICVPNCFMKNCGVDGCGGTCGTCQRGWSCIRGLCEPPFF